MAGYTLMLAKDLIAELQRRIDANAKHEEILGELDICIDVFEASSIPNHFCYKGASSNIRIEHSEDGVLTVLSSFA